MSDDIVQHLSQIDLFEKLPSKVLKKIAAEGTTTSFAPGEHVVEEGASVAGWSPFSRNGVSFYVILEGSGEVDLHGARRGALTSGQYFGEASLIDGQPRTASVTAGPDGMRAFALSAWAFAPILEANPTIAIAMLKVMVSRLRRAEGEIGPS